MAEATRIAGLPTEAPLPTATLDLDAIAKTQTVQTQTRQAIDRATLAAAQAQATATQSALETIIALTPTATPVVSPTPTVAPTPTMRANLTAIWKIYGIGTTSGCTDAAPPPFQGQTGSQNNGASNFQTVFYVVQNGASLSAQAGGRYFQITLTEGLAGSVSDNSVNFQISQSLGNWGGTRIPGPVLVSFSGTRGYPADIDQGEIITGVYSGNDRAGYGCQFSGGFTVYFDNP